MVASGEGVQLFYVEEDGRYRCDEGALRRVAAGSGGGLPVAVVSVAGATRGGKSFLLDFFLRYLNAPEAARRSGAWLGADDEPLTGFNWRGGCERHTEGILIWSEPIIVTLGPEGKHQKVAVVLLDTQGAFDSSSTMRDSSTVFALSTLLSSVQIYNISQNIKEDDLHYLQLFTEYGKLARDEEAEKPFQELRFLVRDWCFAYDHPFGAEGGQQLLGKRLEIRSEQASELREIRTHVRGAFDRVRGFLMPHPGLTVASNPAFVGCLKDISVEFKNALLELVPSLFDPEYLTIKHINGQKVTLQDFTEYFKTYVEIFNSDTLPTPTTVLKATSAAALEAALNACRLEYVTHMERGAGGATCIARGAVPQLHAGALVAARHAFTARRTLAAPALAAQRLDALLQELDASLADYVAMNSGRILEAAARCKAGYEAAMQIDECLTDNDLTAQHNSAVASARKAFLAEYTARPEQGSRKDDNKVGENGEHHQGDSEEDESNAEQHATDSNEQESDTDEFDEENEDWKTLEKELEELLPLHRERNEARAAAAQELARDHYVKKMREAIGCSGCLHTRSLKALHATAAATAADHLRSAWRLADAAPDRHNEDLATYMENKYQEFVAVNEVNNREAIQSALNVYNNVMMEICIDERQGRRGAARCVHPRVLRDQHQRAAHDAAALFVSLRDDASQHLPEDDHETSLAREINSSYQCYEKRNEMRNEEAVKCAHEYYLSHIAPVRGGGEGVLDLLGPPDMDVFKRHPRVKEEAIQHFRMKRYASERNYLQDSHLEELDQKIEKSFTWIKIKFTANIATTSVGAMAMATMMFMSKK